MAFSTSYRPYVPTLVIVIICLTAFVTKSEFAFTAHSDIESHLLFSFCHANIFHLAANLYALYLFKPRWSTCIVAYISAVLVSFIPFISLSVPTLGLSAFVFAAYARKFYFWQMPIVRLVFFQLLTAFIPFLNWRIHIAAFMAAYFMWMAYDYANVYLRRR